MTKILFGFDLPSAEFFALFGFGWDFLAVCMMTLFLSSGLCSLECSSALRAS